MGAYKVVFSPFADRDLKKIVRHVSRDNPDAGQRLGLKLIDRAYSLVDTPSAQTGPKLPKRPTLRRAVEGNYLIYYRVYPKQKKVRILRFLHAARNTFRLRLDV